MEQYDGETLKQLNDWFFEQKKNGFTIEQIKQTMINNGYGVEFSNKFVSDKIEINNSKETNTPLAEQKTTPESNSEETKIKDSNENSGQQNNNSSDKPIVETLNEAQKQEKFKNYSYFYKVKLIITKPKQFFDKMPQEGSYKEPIVFAATNIIVLFSIAIIGMLILSASGIMGTAIASLMGLALIMFIPSMIFMGIIVIIGFVVSVFVGAAINNTWFKLFKCPGTYKATVNVFFYMTAINLLILIPIVGFLSALYQIYVMITGLAKIHNISKKKTLAITLLFGILISIIFMILFAVMFTLLISVFDNLGSMMVPATIN